MSLELFDPPKSPLKRGTLNPIPPLKRQGCFILRSKFPPVSIESLSWQSLAGFFVIFDFLLGNIG